MTDRSEVIVFRDPHVDVGPFACAAKPAFYPLGATLIAAFDATEDYIGLPATSFPSVTGRYDVGSGGLPTTAKQGTLFLDLATDGGVAQAYVLSVQYPESAGGPGQYVALTAGTALDDAEASDDQIYIPAEDP